MAVIKHIAIHASPKKLLRYIMNSDKTDEMKFITGLNCNTEIDSAYEEFGLVFEGYSGERFYKKSLTENSGRKEKVRLHHYIQSFAPGEVTPEEAHKIGVEWAEKVFGRKHQVIVTTHTDKNHTHNHFAVAAYDLNGKKWYGNKTTLKHCRDVSDKICKTHGLSIIENPQYHANQRYGEWLARKNGTSWKQKLCDDIDRLVLQTNVQSITDLKKQLEAKGYVITLGKHMSIKPNDKGKAIRSFRLGDGYAIEELRYRIEHKDREMSIYAVSGYQGIQREYAMCLRQLQLMVYRKAENPHRATYADLRRNAELLKFLFDNRIHSVSSFENHINATAEKVEELKKERERLLRDIEDKEYIVQHGDRYLELMEMENPTFGHRMELREMSYLSRCNVCDKSDITRYANELEKLKLRLAETEKAIEAAEQAKAEAGSNYQTYLRQMQTDYDYILEKLRREQDEIRRAEQERQRELQRVQKRETHTRTRNDYCR